MWFFLLSFMNFLDKQYASPSHVGISTRFSLYTIIKKKKKKKKKKKTCQNLNKLPDLI